MSLPKETLEILEALAPELKESDDERIIKTLQEYVVNRNWILNGQSQGEVLTWLEKQKEHQNNSDAPNESSWAGMISSSDKDKNLDEIAQDYVDGVKEYNPEPTWDLIQTAVCYGYHLGANHQVLDDEHLLSAIQVQFASHAKVENGKRYAKLTWDEFKKIIFELYSCEKQKEQKPAEWNEDDLQHRQWILECLADGERKVPEFAEQYQAAFNWLKSLPERFNLQPKEEWSEEDEKIIDTIVSALSQYIDYKAVSGTGSGYATPRYSKEIDWLKSLRPQQKVEWSEEDSKRYVSIRTTLETSAVLSKEDYDANVVWLRDLVNAIKYSDPKPSWKPSEKQMDVLLGAKGVLRNLQYNDWAKILEELCEQLKQL